MARAASISPILILNVIIFVLASPVDVKKQNKKKTRRRSRAAAVTISLQPLIKSERAVNQNVRI